MSDAKLALSWDAYQRNICNGLSLLQQRGEFVDMTLAADGHHVKVHQMVLSLISPYIKDLISTAQCPHPVIFLNNISYTTLCSVLEYVYTGEVQVEKEKLKDLINAGRALHIKGLREMDDHDDSYPLVTETSDKDSPEKRGLLDKLQLYKEKKRERKKSYGEQSTPVLPICKIFLAKPDDENGTDMDTDTNVVEEVTEINKFDPNVNHALSSSKKISNNLNIQYTVSTHGGLQIIYNRFIYNLRYVRKNRHRLWRCVDYSSVKCPANICTNEHDEVVKRSFTHNHPFHDQRILKKLRQNIIYTALHEAESQAETRKNERNLPCTMSSLDTESDTK